MQLGKKQIPEYSNSTEQQYKLGILVDWRTQEIIPDAEIPYGKYSGRTISEVMEEDYKYYLWMNDKNLLTSWGLVRDKQIQTNMSSVGFRASNGDIWIGLREVPGVINNNANIQIPY